METLTSCGDIITREYTTDIGVICIDQSLEFDSATRKMNLKYPETVVVCIFDLCHSKSMYKIDSEPVADLVEAGR